MPLQASQQQHLQHISRACAHHLASLSKHGLPAFYATWCATSSHHDAYSETAFRRAAFCVWTQSVGGRPKPPNTPVARLSRLLPLLSMLARFPSESGSSCSPSLPGKPPTLWSCGSFSLLLALPVSMFMKPRTSGIFQSNGSKYFTSCNTHTDAQIQHTQCTHTHMHVHKHKPYTHTPIQRQTHTPHDQIMFYNSGSITVVKTIRGPNNIKKRKRLIT